MNSHDEGRQLLKAGQVVALLGSVGDMTAYKDKLHYEDAYPNYTDDERLVCQPGPEPERHLKKHHPVIRSMKADGSLKSILAEYYLLD